MARRQWRQGYSIVALSGLRYELFIVIDRYLCLMQKPPSLLIAERAVAAVLGAVAPLNNRVAGCDQVLDVYRPNVLKFRVIIVAKPKTIVNGLIILLGT